MGVHACEYVHLNLWHGPDETLRCSALPSSALVHWDMVSQRTQVSLFGLGLLVSHLRAFTCLLSMTLGLQAHVPTFRLSYSCLHRQWGCSLSHLPRPKKSQDSIYLWTLAIPNLSLPQMWIHSPEIIWKKLRWFSINSIMVQRNKIIACNYQVVCVAGFWEETQHSSSLAPFPDISHHFLRPGNSFLNCLVTLHTWNELPSCVSRHISPKSWPYTGDIFILSFKKMTLSGTNLVSVNRFLEICQSTQIKN